MDLSAIISILPLIMQAISIGEKVVEALKTGTSVLSLLQNFAPDVIDLIKGIGASLWPNLDPTSQVQAAAMKLYDKPTVTAVQTNLNKLVITNPMLVVDGSMGPKTIAAVTAFQTAHGITADGWPGPETQAALQVAVSAPAATKAVAAALKTAA